MQSVFKGIYSTVSNYQNEISSSVFQVTGALALNNALTRVNLPRDFASQEGIYTIFDTTLGITWNGSYLPAGSALTNKLIIVPNSGYAVITEPYVDSTGKKVKVGLRKATETEDSHTLTFDSVMSSAGNTTREGNTIIIYDASTELQARTLYYSASVLNGADFEDRTSTGSFLLVNGTGSFSKKFRLDLNTEGDELFQFKISNDSSFNKIVGSTPVITVQDVSKSPVITVNSSNISEGNTLYLTASFVNMGLGTLDANYYYVIESLTGSITAADFVDNQLSGTIAVNATTKLGYLEKSINFDGATEGQESFRLSLKQGSYTGDTLASTTIYINDIVAAVPVNTVTVAGSSTDVGPLDSYYWSCATEFVFTAAELSAAGINANDRITGMYICLNAASPWVSSLSGGWKNFVIGMQHTSQGSTMTSSVTSGYTSVYERVGPFVPDVATYTSLITPKFNFTNSFTWDGTSNLLTKVVFSNTAFVSGGASLEYSLNGNMYYARADTSGYTLATAGTGTVTYRPKIGFIVAR